MRESLPLRWNIESIAMEITLLPGCTIRIFFRTLAWKLAVWFNSVTLVKPSQVLSAQY